MTNRKPARDRLAETFVVPRKPIRALARIGKEA